MKCGECKYRMTKINMSGVKFDMCAIENFSIDVLSRIGITEFSCADDIENMRICFNCAHWIGGGDWGLSCRKDYYIATANGFKEACKLFERKRND